jgi:hypothetical protein
MKNPTILLIGILLILVGCGDRIIDRDNCIPTLNYVSTEKATFISYQLIDKKKWRSFDALKVSESGEWLLEIVHKNEQTISDIAKEAVIVERHPSGSELVLLGQAKILAPYGLMTAFHSEMTYLEGKLDDKKVWIPAFYLSALNEEGSNNNIENNKLIGLETFKHNWVCINQ